MPHHLFMGLTCHACNTLQGGCTISSCVFALQRRLQVRQRSPLKRGGGCGGGGGGGGFLVPVASLAMLCQPGNRIGGRERDVRHVCGGGGMGKAGRTKLPRGNNLMATSSPVMLCTARTTRPNVPTPSTPNCKQMHDGQCWVACCPHHPGEITAAGLMDMSPSQVAAGT